MGLLGLRPAQSDRIARRARVFNPFIVIHAVVVIALVIVSCAFLTKVSTVTTGSLEVRIKSLPVFIYLTVGEMLYIAGLP